ncbi:MAG: class I SAM-dependent methyltransferase [Candidatus Pacebacteria bacterium]|nr:class I SAM-dependent methyltransferase [Candidatus Paceibacterota bacterium]
MDKKTMYWKLAWDTFHLQFFNYKGDVDIINDWIKKGNYKVKNILEIGCGAGRYLKFLKKLGYKCVGVDKDVDILEYARQKVLDRDKDIELVQGDILKRTPSSLKGQFDLVLAKHLSFPLLDLEKVLDYTKKVLSPKGPKLLVFDFMIVNKNNLKEEILSIDSAIKGNFFLLRLNQMKLRKEFNKYRWKEIYIIKNAQRDKVQIVKINTRSIWFISRDELDKLLKDKGVQIENESREPTGINNLEGVTIYGKFQ